MSETVLVKRLSSGEKRENWFKIPAKYYDIFPRNSVVVVRIGNKSVAMKVNDRGYMWPHLLLWNQFARLLRFDEDHDELVFVRAADGAIELSSREKQTPTVMGPTSRPRTSPSPPGLSAS